MWRRRAHMFERGSEGIETPGRFFIGAQSLLGQITTDVHVSSMHPGDDARDGVTTLGCLSIGHPPPSPPLPLGVRTQRQPIGSAP